MEVVTYHLGMRASHHLPGVTKTRQSHSSPIQCHCLKLPTDSQNLFRLATVGDIVHQFRHLSDCPIQSQLSGLSACCTWLVKCKHCLVVRDLLLTLLYASGSTADKQLALMLTLVRREFLSLKIESTIT